MRNIVYEKSFAYSVEIVRISKMLAKSHEYELASQLIRSGTSIGANIAESEYAQSDQDFISKLSIALKEAAESRYWLRLLTETKDITKEDSEKMIKQVEEIIKILVVGIKTKKEKAAKQQQR